MSSDKRKKNNEARMKVYDKKKEEETWNQYEHYIVEHHFKKFKHTVWHWSRVPEEHLWNAGYINDFNKHRLERLASSKEGINRHKDYGLDGFALDLDKNYHGLQAKFYSTNKVSANDIGTFYSVTRRLNKKNPLSKGYLYTSTNLEPTLAEDIECIGDIIHEKVLFEPEDKRKTRHQKKVVEEVNLPLRQYQKDALESLKEEREGLGTLSLFCGGGKTLIAGHYLSELKPKIIVMMAPLKISVDNLYQRMESFFIGYDHLVIDSDSGNTTDLDVVKAKLDEDKPIILYTTFASAVNVLSEIFDENEELFEDSFCLVDECHNILNNTELCEFISRFYDGLLMSATIPEELYEVIDCEPVYEYGMAEAIKEEYCVDYNVWLPLVVKKEETNSIEIDIPEEFEKSDLCAKVLFLVNGMLQTGSKRCIVYLRSTDECAAFTELFTKVCKEYHGLSSWTETIDCDVKQEKRRTILNDFQTDKDDLTTLHILASVRILDEAVDVVRCDSEFITYVGVNADDKRAVQRLQRGGRLDSSNPFKKNNLFVWCSEYASMLSMLSLLKDSDPEFHTKLRILNGDYNAVGKKESIEKSAIQLGDLQKYVEVRCLSLIEYHTIKINELKLFYEINKKEPRRLSENIEEKRLAEYIKQRRKDKVKNVLSKIIENKISESLQWFVWDVLSNKHNNNIRLIKEFYEQNKYLPRSSSDDKNEKKLGIYIVNCRKDYKKGEIKKEVYNLINENIPTFIWDYHYEKNRIQVEKLSNFYNKFKEPPKYRGKREYENSAYIYYAHIRNKYKSNEIPDYLKIMLEDKCPWIIYDPIKNGILEKILKIKEFYEKYKKQPSSSDNSPIEEKRFCYFIEDSRQAILKKDNLTDIDKFRKEQIEKYLPWFVWKPDISNNWNNKFKEVKDFFEINQRLPTYNIDNKNESLLATWIGTQRKKFIKNELSDENIKTLESLTIWSWSNNNKQIEWLEKLKKIKEYYTSNNNLPKLSIKNITDKETKSIIRWISDQKKNYKSGILLEERIKALEELNWWKW